MKPLLLSLVACLTLAVPLRAQDQPNGSDTTTIYSVDAANTVALKRIRKAVETTATGASASTVTPTITSATTGGTVAAGSRSLTFVFSTNFTGTVLGVAYSGATDASQPLIPPPGTSLAAVAYTVTAGSVRIVDIR